MDDVLVVGSANADAFLPVPRMPIEGDNLMMSCPPQINSPGGKGCAQEAVASSKLSLLPTDKVKFVGQFGSDANTFQDDLKCVDCSHCRHHQHLTSGRGHVFLTNDGSVSAVVSGGGNMEKVTSCAMTSSLSRSIHLSCSEQQQCCAIMNTQRCHRGDTDCDGGCITSNPAGRSNHAFFLEQRCQDNFRSLRMRTNKHHHQSTKLHQGLFRRLEKRQIPEITGFLEIHGNI